nr:hypothetical protein [Tanacetum cinerariifolium]
GPYALSWKPCQGDSLNLPDHRGPYALSWKPCQGDSLNLPDHSLVPAKSNSYYQAFNVKSLFGEIEMDDPNITMEEYIQLMADNAHKHGQMFDWETAMYSKIYDDIDLFKDFEADFAAIIYNEALASNPKVASKPTVSPHNDIKADFNFTISFSKPDDKDYTFIYDKNSSSYKLIHVNDLKSDTGDDIDEINVRLPSEDIYIKPLDSVINVNANTYFQAFDKSIETNHDTPEKRYDVSAPTLHKKTRTNNSQYGVSLFYHTPYPAG